jgi:HK97 family phage major capsid protein
MNELIAVMGQIKERVEESASSVEGLVSRMGTITARMGELEQMWAAGMHGQGTGTGYGSHSPVAGFLEDARFRAVQSGAPTTGRVQLEQASIGALRAEALFSTGTTGGTYPVGPQRDENLRGLAQRPLSLLDVIPRVEVSTNAFEYIEIAGSFAHAADFQAAEGALKAEQNLPLEAKTAKIATVAAWLRVSTQLLDDAPALRAQIGQLLTNGLLDKLEATIVAGTGAAPGSFVGLLPQATPIVSQADLGYADRIGEAVATLGGAGWKPSAVLVTPLDWFRMRAERSTLDGHYAAADWLDTPSRTAWGVPVIQTSALPAGTALVTDLSQVALLDRMQPALMVSREDRDNFVTNQATILPELRAGLAVFSPTAVVRVELST